jgi:GMP synthase (glutamine-hydrolysing)
LVGVTANNRARRLLVVQNDPGGGARRVGEWLTEAGLSLDVHLGPQLTLPDRLDHDAVVVLGGGFLPDDDVRRPWLPATRALVRQALDETVPVLGICLGGQLLAHVGGGVVEGDVGAPEAGSTPIDIRSEAADDPLFHGFPAVVPAMEHHVDAITTLPPGAVWLASTGKCPYQAFRLGDNAWGLQFHPEVRPDSILTWKPETLAAQGFDRDQLHAQALADEPVSTPLWRTLTQRFATQVTA